MTDPLLSGLLGLAHLLLSCLCTVHILRTKQDVRAAIGWLAAVWAMPFFGPAGYFILGINRIRRVAKAQRARRGVEAVCPPCDGPALDALDPTASPRFAAHAQLGGRLTGLPLSAGNAAAMLVDGDEAYPAMLAAIRNAERTVAFSTYIYEWDSVGRAFAEALAAASKRGVDVSVLVDAAGSFGITQRLRALGIDAHAFNPPVLTHLSFLNLRSHRKLLLVDGDIGFTGGMNIRDIHQAAGETPLRSRDLMFRVTGPALEQLSLVFRQDWRFTAGRSLEGPHWRITPKAGSGPAVMRAIPDGPEDEISATGWIFESALSMARRQVRITTPYFLPDLPLMSALSQAALRGVRVDILVPERSDHRLVGWATEAHFPLLLERGCHIHLTPEPFDHSKIMVVDDYWALIGSSNWDMRSLRLNFELNLEIYDASLARRLDSHLESRMSAARQITSDEISRQSGLRFLRNRAAWLLSPYL